MNINQHHVRFHNGNMNHTNLKLNGLLKTPEFFFIGSSLINNGLIDHPSVLPSSFLTTQPEVTLV